ncbi:hypothetical protein MJL81_30745, partial [Salmonella enterica subsp. enterica serovar Anatum]|nr:hypothetical protein [Salmonella enterica subsp. enterica serovar Anatum]
TAELLQRALVAQLAHSERLTDVQLPEPDEPSARHALPDGEPRKGAEEKSVMMTGWRDCHFTAKVSIFSGSLSTMTRSSGINARA